MIDPKSLRIGNCLMRNGLMVTIDATSIFDIAYYPDTIGKQYSPVVLSPSLLERAGFEKGRISAGANKPEFYTLGRIRIDDTFVSGFEFLPTSTRIRYFHELQNIVRDLDSQELELKP